MTERRVKIYTYDIIYRLLEHVEELLSSKLEPTAEEAVVGVAEVRQVFELTSKGDFIAGCFVNSGELTRNSRYRLIRDGKVITDTVGVVSLRHFDNDVNQVRKGSECGIRLAGSVEYTLGDKIEAYEVRQVQRRIRSVVDAAPEKGFNKQKAVAQ